MAYRGSRLNDTGLAINTEIGSRYDNVRKVADSIEEVSTVADKIDSVIGIQTSLPNINKIAESIDGVNIVADNVDKIPELEVITSELRDAYEEFDGIVDEIKNDKNETKSYLDETKAVAEQIHEITAEAVSSDVTSAVFDPSTGSIKLEVERGSQIFRIASSGKVGQTMTYGRYLFDKEPYINDSVFSINDLVGVVINTYQDTISVNWYSELKGELGYSVYHTHKYVGENEEYLALDMLEVPTGTEPRVGDTVFSPTGIIFRIEAINEIDDMASIKAITNLIGPKGEDGKSITSVVTKYNTGSRTTTVTIYGDFYNAPQSFTVRDGKGGDMYKSTYDSPLGTGVVNKAREAIEAEHSLEADHALKADRLTTPVILSINGDVTGSISVDGSSNVTMETTIQPDSVELGVNTTGNYMVDITAGNGISVSHIQGEGSTATITNSEPNVTTDISTTHSSNNVVVHSSDGTDGTIDSATQTLAGVMSADDKTKLDEIEEGATGDQTADEILTLLKTVDGSGSELDADLLDGQEGAYYLDASNINAGTIDDDRLPDTITSSITGNAATATKLATAVTIALAGDVSGNIDFDGSANVTIETTVQPNSVALGTDTTGNYVAGNTAGTGITISGTAGEGWSPTIAITDVGTAGTYTKVTTNAQGQVTAGTTLSATDIPAMDASKITSGVIDADRLPSYVDDVLEFSSFDDFPLVGETGKIYVAIDTNKTYRWSGTSYVYITSGAVDSVAGKTGVVILNKNDVGLDQVNNTSDVDKPISTATVNALALKANIESPALTGVPTAPTASVGTNTTQLATTAFVVTEINKIEEW